MIIHGRVGHESTLLKDGRHIRDLSYMNRDIKDIVCIDFDPEKFYFHQDNVIKIPEWTGESTDRVLLDLLPFLEHLSQPGLDVRQELKKYGNENPNELFDQVQTAKRDMIQKRRESGFSGVMNTFSTSKPVQHSEEYEENKMFPSQFKPE